ncbi:HNH nuclease domain-containing protein OS=Streptomyces fumanus OX=67302 GN=GCM10018772_60250 PE=4 SV=1 [Streptomyces fumanus]
MDWLERAAKLRQWTRSGTRAPHKPLLLLYALGRFQADADGGLRYTAVEKDLQRLLTAYEYRCTFCGYDGRIGAVPVGLEAAHVRWWALGGPDEVENGLCLCSLHHKLFDKGVLGVDDGQRILVSQRFVGHSPAAREHVTALAGRPLIGPQPGRALWPTPNSPTP